MDKLSERMKAMRQELVDVFEKEWADYTEAAQSGDYLPGDTERFRMSAMAADVKSKKVRDFFDEITPFIEAKRL